MSKVIKSGEIFAMTYGERADHSAWEVYRALQDIDVDQCIDEFMAGRLEERVEPWEFAQWVGSNRKVEKVLVRDWFLGSYGGLTKGEVGVLA